MEGSAACGWPASRYRKLGTGFVVRQMTVVHHEEARFEEPVAAETWIADLRRGLLTTREIRLTSPRGPLASATQEWAHVGPGLRPGRAPAELIEAFPVVADRAPPVSLPKMIELGGTPVHRFQFRCWHTWMDPLGHANHPAYVDWCDEALSHVLDGAGLPVLQLQPVAEWVKFRRGVVAGDEVVVETSRAGRTDGGAAVFRHKLVDVEGRPYAEAVTVRRMADGSTAALHTL